MERITKKKENGFYELKKGQKIYGEENGIRLVQIVGQLEDIEEELGIDLITLFKALKNGVYEDIVDQKYKHFDLSYAIDNVFTIWLGRPHELKDYGKTWALTREELEK